MRAIAKKILETFSPELLHFLRMKRFKKILPEPFINHVDSLNASSVAIDIGANVGLVSELIARTGAKVIAFEPNEEAVKKLNIVASRFSNIEVNAVAAGIKNDTVKLFLHKDMGNSDEDLTQASSFKEEKPNVSSEFVQVVDEIDFADYIESLNKSIDLIKIDIEGYEIELINHLLDRQVLHNVGRVYLETHERKFEALRKATEEMKLRIKKEGFVDKFFYDWH